MYFALVASVNFEQAVETFYNQRAWAHHRCLKADIENTVNFNTGRDFYPKGRITWQRQKTQRDSTHVGRMLGLKIINIDIAAKINAQNPVSYFPSLVVYRAGATT